MLTAVRSAVLCLVGSLLALVLPVSVYAATAEGIAQSYTTDATIRQGMIVGTAAGNTGKVEPLTTGTVSAMLGVAISASDAPIALSDGTTSAQVYVATNGRYDVLVSNQNGVIHQGDYISISALNGIGMKAADSEAVVLGRAAANFNGSGTGTSTATLKQGDGSTQAAVIGLLPVDVAVTANPASGHGIGDLPGFLQIASTAIAHKTVDPARVYISLAVLILVTIIAGSMLYSGVRNALISIGRNPLAKRSVFRGMLQVVLTSLIIFLIGLFAVYLLLRL